MCGIVGYIGRSDAAPVLLAGLHRLEYRGYDSAGIALVTEALKDGWSLSVPDFVKTSTTGEMRAIRTSADQMMLVISKIHPFLGNSFWMSSSFGMKEKMLTLFKICSFLISIVSGASLEEMVIDI